MAAVRIESERRLVEEQHLRRMQQAARDRVAAACRSENVLTRSRRPVPKPNSLSISDRPAPGPARCRTTRSARTCSSSTPSPRGRRSGLEKHDSEAPANLVRLATGSNPSRIAIAPELGRGERSASESSVLPAPLGPRMRKDFAGAHVERDPADGRDLARTSSRDSKRESLLRTSGPRGDQPTDAEAFARGAPDRRRDSNAARLSDLRGRELLPSAMSACASESVGDGPSRLAGIGLPMPAKPRAYGANAPRSGPRADRRETPPARPAVVERSCPAS